MRIALLHYTSAPVIGGVEHVMAHHARLFAEAGHEVAVLRGAQLTDGSLEAPLARQNVVFAHNLLTMPFQPEVTLALWRLAAKLSSVRFITWVHDVAAANPDYAATAGGPLQRYCRHFEYVAVSDLRRCELHEHLGVPLDQCRVIPNGIEPLDQWRLSATWSPFIESARLLDRDLVLLHPARLVPRKNIELSLHVIAALRSLGHDAAMLITAPADVHRAEAALYAEEMHTLHRRLGLQENAFFLSDFAPVSSADLSGFFELADGIFFPSRQEGFGLPLLEAAVHRVPLFCPRIPPLETIVPGNAIYFDPEASPTEIAAIIVDRFAPSPAIQARQAALRHYAWPAIYRNYIAPLLADDKTPSIP